MRGAVDPPPPPTHTHTLDPCGPQVESVNLKSLDETWSWGFPERVVLLKCGENGAPTQPWITKYQRRYHAIDGTELIADHDGGFRDKSPVCLFELEFPEVEDRTEEFQYRQNGINTELAAEHRWQAGSNWVTLAKNDPNNAAVQKMLAAYPDVVTVRPAPKALKRQYQTLAQSYAVIGATDDVLLPDALWHAHLNVSVVSGRLSEVVRLSESDAAFRALLPALLQTTKGVTAISARFRRPFDAIVRCFGWNSRGRVYH
jgi:hypothetical protein